MFPVVGLLLPILQNELIFEDMDDSPSPDLAVPTVSTGFLGDPASVVQNVLETPVILEGHETEFMLVDDSLGIADKSGHILAFFMIIEAMLDLETLVTLGLVVTEPPEMPVVLTRIVGEPPVAPRVFILCVPHMDRIENDGVFGHDRSLCDD